MKQGDKYHPKTNKRETHTIKNVLPTSVILTDPRGDSFVVALTRLERDFVKVEK